MTREEMRANALVVMAEAMAEANSDQTWSEMSEYTRIFYKHDATAALDALGIAGFKLIGPTLTAEMLSAGLRYYTEPLAAYEKIAAKGDLTRKEEGK